MGTIVVGVDGSREARVALTEAIREAGFRDAKVLAVMVIVVPTIAGRDLSRHDVERLAEYGNRVGARELVLAEEAYDGGFPVPVELAVKVGHPATELLRAAGFDGDADAVEGAELVVVGSRGLGGFRGLLLGSVTTHLVHHMPGRLLIVRPDASDDLVT